MLRESGSVTLILPAGLLGQRVRERRSTHPPGAVATDSACPPRLVVAVRATLGVPILDETLTAQRQAFRAVVRDTLGRSGAFRIQATLRVAQPRPTALAGRQPGRQFVAARI